MHDLFDGRFRGHAIWMSPEIPQQPGPGDVSCSELPVSKWVDWFCRVYEARVCYSDEIEDDAVPYVSIATGTGVFASCFGSELHICPDNIAAARPAVTTAEDADRIPQPTLDAAPIRRIFQAAEQIRRRLGDDVPIGIPDIQSPFDIAALIWNKEDMFVAMIEEPEAVHRLASRCHHFLKRFLHAFIRDCTPVNLCHCPYAWAPPELGAWLSEDEAGSISPQQFRDFCLPILTNLSHMFGGLFMHCCAKADYQYSNFRAIPNLRGLNRVFQAPGPKPAIDAFSGQTVLIQAWMSPPDIERMLALCKPNTRLLINMPAQPLDDARRTFEQLREHCPRKSPGLARI
ncbi:MAG TPA: uroporphyrinogen decarboxylase family protein [Tepidisphaeraceae bacterium]